MPNYFSTYKLSDNSLLTINVFDTAGQEKYKSLNEKYYKKADCCILVYDIINRRKFNEIKEYFIVKIKELCKKNVKVILVGNKTDLEDKREISYNEGANLAFLNNFLFIETSCAKNKNVYETFEKIIGIYRLSCENNEENIEEKIICKRNRLFLIDISNKKYINKLSNYLNK